MAKPETRKAWQTVADAADGGLYPARSSCVPVEVENQVDEDGVPIKGDSVVERAVLRPDQTSHDATLLLEAIRRLMHDVPMVLYQIPNWFSTRAVACCQRCGFPLGQGDKRCRRVDPHTELQCGSSQHEEQHCANTHCDHTREPGEVFRDGRCDACYRFRRKHQRDRITGKGIELGANMIVEAGEAYSA